MTPPQALADFHFPPALQTVLRTLHREGFEAFVVGGSIRDLLLGRMPKDFDVATRARADQVTHLFRRVIPTGIEHGTVTVVIQRCPIEVTTFRGEGEYLDGRHPEAVVFLDTVEADLSRRDFTINAMAFDPENRRFVDPFGGRADLERRTVRCVGDPIRRFSEDGLRLLRALRFASVLEFDVEAATLAAIPLTLDTFSKVALERVREEFVRILQGPRPSRGLGLLRSTGLLERFLPELAAMEARGFAKSLARMDALPPALELRLAALLSDLDSGQISRSRKTVLKALLERLRFSKAEVEAVQALAAHRAFGWTAFDSDAALRRGLSETGVDLADALLALAHAEADARRAVADFSEEEAAAAHARIDGLKARIDGCLSKNPPLTPAALALDGGSVMRILGCPPGPAVGKALQALMRAVLEFPEDNTPERLEAILRSGRRREG